MKNSLLIAAVAMMAVPAMASKARLSALNNAAHLEDVQDVFVNPSKLGSHGDWLTFEMGATHSANQVAPAVTTPQGPYTEANPNAEGGFARGMGDAKYGFYLGHHSTMVAESRLPNAYVTSKTFLTDENPVDLFYSGKAGDLKWGVGAHYANSDKKSTKTKQTAGGLNAGVTAQNWDVALNLGLVNTFKNDTTGAEADFKGKTAIGVNGTYTMETLTFSALANMNGGKDDQAGAGAKTDLDVTHYNVGVVNSHKADGADFFYGANYDMFKFDEKEAGKKYEASQLPVFAGIEADATSWMVLRASVSQNFVLGSVKTDYTAFAPTSDSDTISNNTVVAAGVGLKFNKLQLDGTLKAANSASASLDGNNFLGNASLTYLF